MITGGNYEPFETINSTSKYKDIKVWLLILVYFIFPYILNWITKKIFTIYDYLNYLFLTYNDVKLFINLNNNFDVEKYINRNKFYMK